MGANAQTSVPTFTAGEILTAANMNISARTGIPVFADTTARDAAFGGTGEKTLAEGQYAYIENIAGSAATQYYDGATWQTLVTNVLTLISATTVGTTVSSVQVTNAFSATYDYYKIVAIGGVMSAADNIKMILGATTTGYYSFLARGTAAGVADFAGDNNAASWQRIGSGNTDSYYVDINIGNPFATKRTYVDYTHIAATTAGSPSYGKGAGYLNNATSYTDFTISPGSGTMTGGAIYVYGYAKS